MLDKTVKYHGYTSKDELLQAINGGELATVLLPDEQRAAAIEWIEKNAATIDSFMVGEALESIARQLQAAIEREKDTEKEIINELLDK